MMKVVSVSQCESHNFSKNQLELIHLIEGEGIKGDAHCGIKVKHRSRVKKDPSQLNLRQVHLIHNELIGELQQKGFNVYPGSMGENITTSGIDLLGLPTDTMLKIGEQVKIKITGLRNPCVQLDDYQKGLTAAVLDRDEKGNLIRKAGVMGIVIDSGDVKTGDEIQIFLPPVPHQPLVCV